MFDSLKINDLIGVSMIENVKYADFEKVKICDKIVNHDRYTYNTYHNTFKIQFLMEG